METKPRTRWTEISKNIFKNRKESCGLQIRMNISTIIQVTTAVIPNVNYVNSFAAEVPEFWSRFFSFFLNGFPFSSHDDPKILGDDLEQDFCKSIRSSLFSKKTLKKTRQILDQYSRKIKLGNNFNFSSYSRNLPMDDFDPRRWKAMEKIWWISPGDTWKEIPTR